jgi:hypothetical protein
MSVSRTGIREMIFIGGTPFDPDTVQPDQRGETPIWMIARSDDVA